MHKNSRSGFSLIEMAMVLAIIGLIIGGVMGGRALIRGSAISGIGQLLTHYSDATQQFRQQYGALPGDMVDATNYWGAAHGTPATCKTTVSGTKETCNGNGNGQLQDLTGSNEFFRFWQHLSNSGLITGNYTGVAGPRGATDSLPGTNAPNTTIKGSSFFVESAQAILSSNGRYWVAPPTLRIGLGLDTTITNGDSNSPILRPEEAKSIDEKFDDGLPATGSIVTRKDHPNCVTTTTMSSAKYRLTYNQASCTLYILATRHWNKG